MSRLWLIILVFLSMSVCCNADPLTVAIRSLDMETFSRVMKNNPTINATDSAGMTPLHHACALGAVEMTTSLLAHGANPSVKSNEGKTALHYAVSIAALCFNPQPPEAGLTICPLTVPQLLASAGVDVNTFDNNGDAPLHIAARNGLVGVIATLIQAGANPDIRNKNGATPLHLVGGMLPHISAQVLLLNGADPEILDNNGKKPIDLAIDSQNTLLVNMIQKYAKTKQN